MKKIFIYIATVSVLIFSSCKDFLDVEPIDKLTGNNFFKSASDVEANINNLSLMLFNKVDETHFLGSVGEYRSGQVKSEPFAAVNAPAKVFIDLLAQNKLLDALQTGTAWDSYNLARITNWKNYYQVVQGAGILIARLNEGVPGVSETQKKQFLGEAAFARCYAYFVMVRLFGDVPYYNDPFHIEPLARENMVSVLNKCIADMSMYKDGLPWTYDDPTKIGVRAGRGSAVALLMHMNMWNAGFDTDNGKYYQAVAKLGDELVKSNAFTLLPINQWETVIKGRSRESLFEFYRSINYSEASNPQASVADMFLHYPFKKPYYQWVLSSAYYRAPYMRKIFPETVSDDRKTEWFQNIYANEGNFMLIKYAQNVYSQVGSDATTPDNAVLIFRYADAILLRAEALAELGENAEALKMLAMVRGRANAEPYNGVGQDLKEFIFAERARELFGEGQLYFDLVRTKRILSPDWTAYPLNLDQFNRGGWTWPIASSALNNNPYMVLNSYWLNGGV
jgi:hypothetical protein